MLRIERAPPPRNKSAPPLATGVPLGSHLPSPASPQILHRNEQGCARSDRASKCFQKRRSVLPVTAGLLTSRREGSRELLRGRGRRRPPSAKSASTSKRTEAPAKSRKIALDFFIPSQLVIASDVGSQLRQVFRRQCIHGLFNFSEAHLPDFNCKRNCSQEWQNRLRAGAGAGA